jgi:hypothetical protein
MYSEDLERENFEREIKKLKYEKWVAQNEHASDREKKEAKWEYTYCNTFSRSNVKKRRR